MKNSIIIILMFAGLMAYGQKSNIPAKVNSGFKAKFSQAEEPTWSKDGDENFVVNFYESEMEKFACFDANGIWLYTSTVIDESELPNEVSTSLSKQFIDMNVTFVEYKVTNKNENLYLIQIQPIEEELEEDSDDYSEEIPTWQLIFDPNGKLLSKKEML